ncbi:MAG TPA: adenylate/guanylate cyclase domain-containing protein, partial [Chthoniobacteraceae bacterium]
SDARKDLRFACSPLVVGEPFVRFYAGQPLRGPKGYKVGTLCVLDRVPRNFDSRERQILRGLAALVEKEMQMQETIQAQAEAVRAKEALAESERELAAAVRELQTSKQRADDLLNNILPPTLAAEMLETGSVAPVHYPEVAVMFTDFAGFTKVASTCCPVKLVGELNECFCHFDWVVSKHGGEKLKTIGDGFLAVAGMPESRPDDALRLLRAALEIRDFMLERKAEREKAGLPSWEVRIGLHIGPLVAGVVGVRKLAYDVWGDTVNTASRVESAGVPGRVNASCFFHSRVRDSVVSEARGAILCKNKGCVEMYFIDAVK